MHLIRGEAFFEVAHYPERPFIVTAGEQQVTAVGTAFQVRYEPDHIDVTLVEGKVSVNSTQSEVGVPHHHPASIASDVARDPIPRTYLMAPGERLRISKTGPSKVDEPRVEAVTAWRRGEVMLDDTPLSDAVAEMNRYNRSALILDEPRISDLKVSGIYHTGDSAGFAATVANLYGLHVTEVHSEIHLSSTSPAGHH